MQVKASEVHIKTPEGKEKVHKDVQILMSDWGVYIKPDDDSLLLVTWEKVHSIIWNDVKVATRVWSEAVLEALEDMMDDEYDFLEEEEPEPALPDDPNVDPFEARSAARKVKQTKLKAQQERNRREALHAAGASSKGAGAGIDKNALKDKDDMKKYLGEAMSAAQVSTASVEIGRASCRERVS